MAREPKNPFDQFMEEADELLAPFKLALRLMRKQPKSTPDPKSIISRILGWEGFSAVFFTCVGLTILGIPNQYGKARIFFALAAIAAVLKLVHSINTTIIPKFAIAILSAVIGGIAVNRVNDWVTGLEYDAIGKNLPEIRVTISHPVPKPEPPRNYLVFDGPPRFPKFRDSTGQFRANKNFMLGDVIGFDLYLKLDGKNPVNYGTTYPLLDVEPDADPQSEHAAVAHFKKMVADYNAQHKERSSRPIHSTDSPWFSAVNGAVGTNATLPRLTQVDLDELAIGKQVIFVVAEVPYTDNGKGHHARLCYYLQPPPQDPGIWHYCEGDFLKGAD